MINLTHIEAEIKKILPQVIDIRHYLHSNPELSLQEYKTSKFIREQLSRLQLELLPPFLETDVVAILNKTKTEKNVTLRADIDALPINEKTSLPFCSKNPGVMHACGHDGHTSILLGTAIVLEKFREFLNGSVKFVFQPGEENVAAGKDLVKSGVLNTPRPNVVFALHGWPGYPVGAICSRKGTLMAAADYFKIKLTAEGGHGSKSNLVNNPIVIASRIINELSQIPTKYFSPERVVASVTKMVAGSNSNVIPNEVVVEGSVRYLEKSDGINIPQLFKEIIENNCKKSEVESELDYSRPYIPTVNNDRVIEICKDAIIENLGTNNWVDIEEPILSSEDFSYYIDKNPGAMFFLGMGENSYGLHTENYNFNDEAIKNGILLFVIATIKFLNEGSSNVEK